MDLEFQWKINTRGLDATERALAACLRKHKNVPAIKRAYEKAGADYNLFIRVRYMRNASGGGNWAPLAPSTVKRKKQNKDKIMIEFEHLYDAIPTTFRNTKGWSCYHIRTGVACGYSNKHKHPNSNLTYMRLAYFHATGKGGLPRRQIVVVPDRKTKTKMASRLREAIRYVVRTRSRPEPTR